MGNKIIARVDEAVSLEEVCKRIDQRRQFSIKKIKDMAKKHAEEMEALGKENASDWQELISWLRENNRLPDGYTDQTHNVSFDLGSNGVFVEHLYKNKDKDISKYLKPIPFTEIPEEVRQAMLQFLDKKSFDEE